LPSSAVPGEIGNVVVLGHRDTFFRPLRRIAQGDTIRVRTSIGSFQYIVDLIQVVAPEHSLTFQNMPAKSITLITCFPFDYMGPARGDSWCEPECLILHWTPPCTKTCAESRPPERIQ
jgi:sortase A